MRCPYALLARSLRNIAGSFGTPIVVLLEVTLYGKGYRRAVDP